MHTEALRANLERTAVEVAVPPEHEVLLEITSPLYGVRNDTERLLREIHHEYVGWADTVPELHRRAMGDLYHYNAHERGPEGLAVYGELYAKTVEEATPEVLRADAMRLWVAFLEKVVTQSGDRLERNLGAVDDSLSRIESMIAASAELAATASARLKRVLGALDAAQPSTPAAGRAGALVRLALDRVYAMWLEREDPAAWFRRLRPPSAGDGTLPAPIAAVSHRSLEAHLTRLRAAGDGVPAAELLALPDHATITRAYLEAADALDGAVDDRARWLCRVLGEELLAEVHERALWTLARSCRSLVAGADREQFDRFVGEVFATLRAGGSGYGAGALDLVRRIGVAVLEGGRPEWVDLVIDEILTLEFQRPDFSGFTDEWAVRVNPNHLRNLRAHLGIISTGPAAARRLLAALVIHIDVGGVFVADTDLFQKDVSELLAADIGPVCHQVRHLLRRLPVYFSDIGAEGELRDVSTRIDEITGRKDPICHFLRKQSHVESNPVLITVVEEVARFWTTGDGASLRRYLPEELHSHVVIEDYAGLHRVFRRLTTGLRLEDLFEVPMTDVERALDELDGEDPIDREKAGLLFRLRFELARKYSLDHADLVERLRGVMQFDPARIDALQADLVAGRHEPALDSLVAMLEDLREIVLEPGPADAVEDIYRKRHIGTGIPSMYGRYREARLEAMGLSFRIESLAGALFDRIVAAAPVVKLDDGTLRRVGRWLRVLERVLDVEGYGSQGLALALSMLDDALALGDVSRDEFADIFRAISQSVQEVVRTRVLDVYGDLFEALGPQMLARGELQAGDGSADEAVMKACETFLRSVIAESTALPRIDGLAGAVLHAVGDPGLDWHGGRRAATARAIDVVRIHGGDDGAGALHLGNKGFMLTRLARYRLPIPDGYILPTALSRRRPAGEGAAARLPGSVVDLVQRELRVLEHASGSRFGDRADPLLLSVRGGAPISMPGMLDSFLDVGINPEIAEGLGASRGSAWGAWDAYRRFLQFWGMSQGIDRDLFDALISAAKQRFSVAKKALLSPEQMRGVAGEYRALIADHGIVIIDEPFEQLIRCIELALGSWDSAMARLYRAEMMIAEGWGTAVIVQNMVYGNLDSASGTGVLLTYHPRRDPNAFDLFGDFVIQGQGDDVVSGLTETFPISSRQRPSGGDEPAISLESSFPEIYAALVRASRMLIEEHGWPHQEVEFTFESERPEDLYILQSREAVADAPAAPPAFVPSEVLRRSRLASGIGVGGGAMSCRVARNEEDIIRLRVQHPTDPILLVRPDTVPDDIHLLLQADALLTAIGGATSHAAVVAKRLGKTCVVGCRELRVFEGEGTIEIAGRPLAPGDLVSISGIDGSVYLGRHEVEQTRQSAKAAARIGVSA